VTKYNLPHIPTSQTRKGRNPQTGAEISIAESTTPVFKSGKVLKEAVKL